jgi:hypothetical protein
MNSEGIGRYRDYVAKDIVNWADKTFLTRARSDARAIVGRSSGGFGALSIARFHTDVFGHVAAHSSDSCFEYCYLHELPQAAGPLLKAGGIENWYRDFINRSLATKMKGAKPSEPVLTFTPEVLYTQNLGGFLWYWATTMRYWYARKSRYVA